MYIKLQSKNANQIASFLQNHDVYDEEEFIFAYDIDIQNTTELDLRNSLFNYQMLGYASLNQQGNIKETFLLQVIKNQRCNSLARIELLSVSNMEFAKECFKEIIEDLKLINVKKIILNLMRRQLNERNRIILRELGFRSEVVYAAKDNDTLRDCITYTLTIKGEL